MVRHPAVSGIVWCASGIVWSGIRQYPALCGVYPALCGVYPALCGSSKTSQHSLKLPNILLLHFMRKDYSVHILIPDIRKDLERRDIMSYGCEGIKWNELEFQMNNLLYEIQ